MISANKIAKWIRRNGSPPATLPAKELCEGPHEATEVFWECTFRASDHCQQMREREMPVICKFTATSFQRGLESQRTARSSAQVQTWVGRGLVDRGKEGKKGQREMWQSAGREIVKPEAARGQKACRRLFREVPRLCGCARRCLSVFGSTTCLIPVERTEPPNDPVLGQSPTRKHSMSCQRPRVEGLVCSAAAWCSDSKVAQRLCLSVINIMNDGRGSLQLCWSTVQIKIQSSTFLNLPS